MEEVHNKVDNLLHETEHLDRIIGDGVTPEKIELVLSQAKRVRKHATLVIQALGRERDNDATA